LYKIRFYKDKSGNKPVLDYLRELVSKTDKNSRIKANKIREYIKILKEYGTLAGEPYIKHIEGDIWELRPLRDRIFFVEWTGESFLFISQFMKKTQKTPKKEIEKAKRLLNEYRERSKKGDGK